MKGKKKGLAVRYNGRKGIAYHDDQKKNFRCPCCGGRVSNKGKVLITPTDKFYGELEDAKKVLVKEEDVKITGFID